MPIRTNTLPTFPFHSIIDWYKKNGRHDLPWRDYTHDSQSLLYRVWSAEIMLQQTQAGRVRDYYTRFLKRFPTVESLANSDWDTFFPYYEGLGYYRRGRNMLALAQEVMSRYGGIFPSTIEELESLPGVGPYSARAICAFALDQPVLSFDTNLSKIFARYYFGTKHIKLTKQQEQEIQQQFESTGISGRDCNNAMMDFGSLISIRNPEKIDWENYPLTGCTFTQEQGMQETITHNSSLITHHSKRKDELEIIVHLHEDHKKYFSENLDEFEPFRLPKHEGDHRHFIKEWFTKKYGLTVSVRPPYERDDYEIRYHAQIQSGSAAGLGEFGRVDYLEPILL